MKVDKERRADAAWVRPWEPCRGGADSALAVLLEGKRWSNRVCPPCWKDLSGKGELVGTRDRTTKALLVRRGRGLRGARARTVCTGSL